MKKLLFFLVISFSFQVEALVDYSEPTNPGSPDSIQPAASSVKQRITRNAPPSGQRSSRSSMGHFSLGMGYLSSSVETGNANGKAGIMTIQGSFQTNYDLFADVSFWRASSSDADISENSSGDWGNPKVTLGFNWLRFGGASDGANVDLYGGLSVGGSGEYARTGTDKIFGIRTTKNFVQFLLQLGYEYTLSGSPDAEDERSIGDRQKIFASLMWRVAPNIRISLDGQTVSVAEGSEGVNSLQEKQTFATVTPRLGLLISPNVQLELGANFASKKASDRDSLLAARLWDEPGAFGNSLFAGLGLSL